MPEILAGTELTTKQRLWLLLNDREAFFGGAAGGGKSVAQILSACQHADIPGYAAIIFRRTSPQLNAPEGLVPLSHRFLAHSGADWSEGRHRWTFPGGATLTFGHLQHEVDKYDHQGAAYQYVGFDELTQFTESMYLYLSSRLRRPDDPRNALSRVPLRLRATSNPPDEMSPGWGWVKSRFIDQGQRRGIPFIPSGLDDNPFLDRASYREQLELLDPVTRRRLRDGDWDVKAAGRMFSREWFGEPLDESPSGLRLVRFWDLAHTKPQLGKDPDYTCGCLYGVDESQFVLLDMRRIRASPGDVESLVKATAEMDGGHVSIRMEQEPAGGKALIDFYARRVLAGRDFEGVPARSADPMARWGAISSTSERGAVKVVRGAWNEAFFDEIEQAPAGTHDDQLTAWAGAHAHLALGCPEPAIF